MDFTGRLFPRPAGSAWTLFTNVAVDAPMAARHDARSRNHKAALTHWDGRPGRRLSCAGRREPGDKGKSQLDMGQFLVA